MKKYLLTSVISLTLSIALIVHLYKTKDIEWVDAIVETSTKAFGITPKMVTEKAERKIREKKSVESLIVAAIPMTAGVDSAALIPMIDSAVVPAPIVNDDRKKRAKFNAEITSPHIEELVPVDSTSQASAVAVLDVTPLKKKKLFNAAIDPVETTPAKAVPAVDQLVYFKAEVNTPQRFGDDQEILFRTSEKVTIGNAVIPEKVVFRAKANVFDGRIHFIVKSIHNVALRGENFKEQLPGIPISADVKLDKSYFLSEGFPVVFGVRL